MNKNIDSLIKHADKVFNVDYYNIIMRDKIIRIIGYKRDINIYAPCVFEHCMLDTLVVANCGSSIYVNNIKSLCKHYMAVFGCFADSAIILDNDIFLPTKFRHKFIRIITVLNVYNFTILSSPAMFKVELK